MLNVCARNNEDAERGSTKISSWTYEQITPSFHSIKYEKLRTNTARKEIA